MDNIVNEAVNNGTSLFNNTVSNINFSALVIPEAVVTLILALAICFFGYKLKRIAFCIAWFIIGYNIGKLIPSNFVNNDPFWVMVLPIATGAFCSLIGFTIERFCVSLLAAAVGFFGAMHFLGGDFTIMSNIIIAVTFGVIMGCVAVALMKPMVIIITAIAGGYYAALSILALAGGNLTYIPFFYIFAIGIGLFGGLFQIKSCRGRI